MKFIRSVIVFFAACCSVCAQQAETGPYQLTASIPIPGVRGGFDHFAYDQARQRLYLAASDNGTVEVISLNDRKRLQSVNGFKNPHSIVLRAGQGRILVTDSGPDASAMLDVRALQHLKTLDLALGANCVVVSRDGKTIFVTAGGDRVKQMDSVLQAVDANTGVVRRSIRVPAQHLQPMALDASGKRLFVNLADKDVVAVFDPATLKQIASWKIPQGHRNSPIVFDAASGTVYVVATQPGVLIALDGASGKLRTSIPTPSDPDDLGFDPETHRLFVPGEKELAVYQIDSPSSLHLLEKLPTPTESHTGIFLPDHHAFALAAPADKSHPAQVLIFGASR